MAGDLRISMLIEADAKRAKAEVASMREEVAKLAPAGQDAAAGLGKASDGAAEWGSAVQMLRASLQPMVAEANALAAAADEVAIAEEMGALSAREAAVAQDGLARAAIELQTRMDALGVTLDGNVAAMGRQESAYQQLIGQMTGLSRQQGETIADTLRHGQALDDLRARFNPLFAASRQYELVLGEIAEAERMGAISAMEAAGARDRAAQSMLAGSAQVRQFGASTQASAQYVGQLGFQLNDIGMMMSLGQSPFMLMMQQGPQVTQVFDQMRQQGMKIGPAIATAFTQMLNPMNLVTMAVIGFGAAAVQWFMSSAEAAEDAEDAISRLSEIRSGLSAAQSIEKMGVLELIDKYGLYAFQVRQAAQAQTELRIAQAKTALAEGVRTASEDIDRFAGDADSAEAFRQRRRVEALKEQGVSFSRTSGLSAEAEATLESIEALQKELGVTEEAAGRMADAFRDVQQAATFEDRISAMEELQSAIRAAGVDLSDLPPTLQDALAATAEVTLEMGELRAQIDSGRDGLLAMVAAAPGGGWLAGAISDASTLAGTLWNAATAASAAMKAKADAQARLGEMQFEFSPGGQALINYGSRSPTRTTAQDSLVDRNTPDEPASGGGGGGGGGGGSSEIEDQRDALADLIAEQERQIELLRTTDPAQRAILENHEALAGATEEERAAVLGLIAERERLQEIRDSVEEIGQTGKEAFTGLITGAHGFSDALGMIAEKLADMWLSDGWDMLWGGGNTGWGGLGGIVSGLFGGNGSAPAAAMGAMNGSSAPASWSGAAGAAKAMGVSAARTTVDVNVRTYFDDKSGSMRNEMVSIAQREGAAAAQAGIEAFSSHALPSRMAEIDANPRVTG